MVLLWRDRLKRSSLWRTTAAILIVADLVVAHRGLNKAAPASLVSFRPPVIDAVATTDHSRIYVYDYMTLGSSQRYLKRDDPYVIYGPGPGTSLEETQLLSQRLYPFPPVAGRWGLEGSYDLDLRGLYPLPLGDLVQFLRRVEGTPAHRRLLELGAVRSVVSLHTSGLEDLGPARQLPSLFPDPIRIFRVPDPLPRAYAVDGVRLAQGRAALEALADPAFEPKREIVLSAGAPRASDPAFRGEVRLATLAPDRVEMEAELSADGYVILVDSYDPGWKATIDGAPADLLRVNVAFRGVPVPAGRHRVAMRYRPGAVLWGLSASALSWTVLALVAPLKGGTTPPTGSGLPLPG
jgi:membrane protein YfhO